MRQLIYSGAYPNDELSSANGGVSNRRVNMTGKSYNPYYKETITYTVIGPRGAVKGKFNNKSEALASKDKADIILKTRDIQDTRKN